MNVRYLVASRAVSDREASFPNDRVPDFRGLFFFSKIPHSECLIL